MRAHQVERPELSPASSAGRPSRPTCPTVSIKGNLEASGRPQTITIIAVHNGTPAPAGTKLLVSGPGFTRIVRLGPGGTVTVTLSPRSKGTLMVTPGGIPGCAATTINIASVSPAAVTG